MPYIGIGNRIDKRGQSWSSYWTPQNFLVTLYNPDGVDQQDAIITWKAHPTRETEIYRSLDGAAYALLTTVAPNTGTYTDSLFDGETHTVEYKARFKEDTTVLSTPANFTAVDQGQGVIRLTVDAVTDADHYEWWGNIEGAGYALITTTVNPTYDHSLGGSTQCLYKVRAKEGTLPVYSLYSTEIDITTAVVHTLYDTFTDTDTTRLGSHTMDVGAGWTEGPASNWQISSNKAVETSGYGNCFVIADAGKAAQDISVDVTMPALNTTKFANAIVFRYNAEATCWKFQFENDATQPYVGLYKNGVQQGLLSNQTFEAGGVRTLRVVASGDSIKCYYAGNLIFDISDSTHNDKTKAGMFVYAAAPYTGLVFDNFILD